jgi:ABC-type multidrug transport system fused ATPase/permease subunit
MHNLSYSFQAHGLSPFWSPSNASLFTTSRRPDAPGYSPDNLRYYLGIYILFSVAGAILGTIRYWYIYTGSIRASRRLFDKLCFTILRTPLRWMDTVPLGRILNRFTADFNVVDGRLANDISFGAYNFFRLLGVIVAGCVPFHFPCSKVT